MNKYKVITTDRWDGTEFKCETIEAQDIDWALITAITLYLGDDIEGAIESLEEANEYIWGNANKFDGGESMGIELNEGSEMVIVKIA